MDYKVFFSRLNLRSASPSARSFLDYSGGNAAVEFAMIAPVLMALVLGTLLYGYVLLVHHGVQQLAAEAARAAVAGLSDAERDTLARDFVGQNASSYAILDPAQLRVTSEIGSPPTSIFRVSLRYDLRSNPIYRLSNLIPLPEPIVQRSAAIQRGGY